jgi:hypothetical protein
MKSLLLVATAFASILGVQFEAHAGTFKCSPEYILCSYSIGHGRYMGTETGYSSGPSLEADNPAYWSMDIFSGQSPVTLNPGDPGDPCKKAFASLHMKLIQICTMEHPERECVDWKRPLMNRTSRGECDVTAFVRAR